MNVFHNSDDNLYSSSSLPFSFFFITFSTDCFTIKASSCMFQRGGSVCTTNSPVEFFRTNAPASSHNTYNMSDERDWRCLREAEGWLTAKIDYDWVNEKQFNALKMTEFCQEWKTLMNDVALNDEDMSPLRCSRSLMSK